MPKRLAADARRIRGDCIRDGTFLNLMFLARELEKVVYDDQTTSSSTPALVVIPPDLVVHGADALSQMTGMSLRVSGAASSTEVGLVGGTDGEKWCDRCPHPKGVVCFVDPAFKGPFPVFIHNNVERKKALLKKKADNAREAGMKNERVANPTTAAVEAYEAREARRAAGRGGLSATHRAVRRLCLWRATAADI